MRNIVTTAGTLKDLELAPVVQMFSYKLMILCKDTDALLHVISLVDWPKHVKFLLPLGSQLSPNQVGQGEGWRGVGKGGGGSSTHGGA